MHFLFVNDDGIGAVGLTALIEAAAARGHRATVCAPAGQMSAASHRITLGEPISVKACPSELPGVRAYAIGGTPADCARIGVLGGLNDQPYDMAISGINNGYNAGTTICYSGTVGAARESAMLGLRAVAASIDCDADPACLRDAAEYVIEAAEKYALAPRLPLTVLNVNIPNLPRSRWAAPVYASVSRCCYRDCYEREESAGKGVVYRLKGACLPDPLEEGSDGWYLERNHVVFSLLSPQGQEPAETFKAMNLLD